MPDDAARPPRVTRGVYFLPWYSADGRNIAVAVDSSHREVFRREFEGSGDDAYDAAEKEAWEVLDRLDPLYGALPEDAYR